MWVPVEFVLLSSLAMSPGFVLAAETSDVLQKKGATTDISKYVTDPLKVGDEIHSRHVQSVR